MLHDVLSNYGFNHKESKIYLSGLQLGEAAASSIARHAGENRITTYSILKTFSQNGIASEITRNGVKYYKVIDPEILISKFKEKLTTLESALPELIAFSNQFISKPKFFFFEGVNGIKQVYEDLLNYKEDIFSFLSVHKIPKELKTYLDDNFLPKRVQKNIWANVIVSGNKENKNYKNNDEKFLRKTLLIDDKIFGMENEIIIYGKDKVAICMLPQEETSGIIIQSKSLHNSMKSIFNLIWKTKYE